MNNNEEAPKDLDVEEPSFTIDLSSARTGKDKVDIKINKLTEGSVDKPRNTYKSRKRHREESGSSASDRSDSESPDREVSPVKQTLKVVKAVR